MADGRIMYEPRFPTIPSFDSQGANSIPIFRALKDSRLSQKYLVNFKHDKFLWDLADSWSLRKRNAEKWKNF